MPTPLLDTVRRLLNLRAMYHGKATTLLVCPNVWNDIRAEMRHAPSLALYGTPPEGTEGWLFGLLVIVTPGTPGQLSLA